MTSDGYRLALLRFDPPSLQQVSRLLRLVFPKAGHLTPAYLDWLYAANPDGAAIACSAFAGDVMVGHLGTLAMRARVEGEERRGLLLLNSAVHPQHRRRQLMSRLSEAIFPEGVRHGYSFCISTGNRYSTLPLLTRFKMLRPLEARIGLGTPRLGGRDFRPSFERLWSDEALRWRLANPEAGYAARRAGPDVLVTAPAGLGVEAILYNGPGNPGAAEANAPQGSLRLWLGLDPAIDWARSAFLPIPRFLRPSPLNLLFRDMSGTGLLPDPDRIIFRGLDFDAY
ncbi:MAG TPA: GNAT family N-acetyltransferase [Allosphingosinicella sp.]|nr:GNAT family N-acetyltransferase [Allosphingosinicella sp.]